MRGRHLGENCYGLRAMVAVPMNAGAVLLNRLASLILLIVGLINCRSRCLAELRFASRSIDRPTEHHRQEDQ